MITKQDIDLYIDRVPQTSKILIKTLKLLNEGELTLAARVAENDLSLNAYLTNLINKPIYGLKNRVNNIPQIFGILGIDATQQTLYNYMINLLSPKEWKFFKLNITTFNNLQAELSTNWKKILIHLKIEDKNIESAIALLPSSIIVAEAIFKNHIENINAIRMVQDIDLNTILKRLSGLDLFDICEKITLKWDMPQVVAQLIQSSSGTKPSSNREIDTLAKWMHLLLFYTLSKKQFVESQLNDFIDFQIDYVDDIYSDFAILMDIS